MMKNPYFDLERFSLCSAFSHGLEGKRLTSIKAGDLTVSQHPRE